MPARVSSLAAVAATITAAGGGVTSASRRAILPLSHYSALIAVRLLPGFKVRLCEAARVAARAALAELVRSNKAAEAAKARLPCVRWPAQSVVNRA